MAATVATDMHSRYGLRSTSSSDPRYSNVNEIKPYSNWRGPVWVNANAMLIYGLNSYANVSSNAGAVASQLAKEVVNTLADDLESTQTWHECYNSDSGHGLAAPGFLSWDTLGATLTDDVNRFVDPFQLRPL